MEKKGMGGRRSREHVKLLPCFLKVILYLSPSRTLKITLKVDPVIIPIPQMRKLSLQEVK